MIIEVRINKNYTNNWNSIEPILMKVKNGDAANSLAESLANFNEREIRWNKQGCISGHYFGLEYRSVSELDLEFEKTLVISTGHITLQDSESLYFDANDEHDSHCLIVNGSRYAWDVHLSQDEESINETRESMSENYSESFMRIIKIARENDCHWVKFDQDGPHYNGLEEFEW